MKTSEYNPFNNPISIEVWCEAIMAKPIGEETDTLIHQIIHTNSMFKAAFGSIPEKATLTGEVRFTFEVSEVCMAELKEILPDALIYHEPSLDKYANPYYWVVIGGHPDDKDKIQIVIHTTPKEVVFLHNLNS